MIVNDKLVVNYDKFSNFLDFFVIVITLTCIVLFSLFGLKSPNFSILLFVILSCVFMIYMWIKRSIMKVQDQFLKDKLFELSDLKLKTGGQVVNACKQAK